MFCPADGEIAYDNDFLFGPAYQIGDFVVGLLPLMRGPDAVQTQLLSRRREGIDRCQATA
jgi:hypothetical protein